jgi:transposase-like protein
LIYIGEKIAMESKKQMLSRAKFKFCVALEALKGQVPIKKICREFGVTRRQIYAWKKKLQENVLLIFDEELANTPHDQQIN